AAGDGRFLSPIPQRFFSLAARSGKERLRLAQTARVKGFMMTQVSWPRKTRELHSHHFDSTVWNEFRFRDDDIIVATYAKSGTTWTQQIVGQLIYKGADQVPVSQLSPWLDLRLP